MGDKEVQQACMDTEYEKTGISPNDIAVLRSWVTSQPHLPEIPDLSLILGYHHCDRSLELAKNRIDVHFTSRTNFKTLFKNRAVDENIIKALKTFVFYVLPETWSYNKTPILFASLIDFRVSSFSFIHIARTALMMLDLLQYEYGCTQDAILVLDCVGGTIGHVLSGDIQVFQQGLSYYKDAIFGKLKAVHFLNTPSFATTVLRILRPLIPEELLNLVTFHDGGSRAIEKIIPVEYLPIETGGRYKTFEQISNELIEKLTANKEIILRENNLRVNEARRPGKTSRLNNYRSACGSFKMLNID